MAEKAYSLFEFDHLDEVYLPIRSTARVKYTCFDVSRSYLIFGANSGSLYFFQRDPLQYVCVLSNKEGSVSMLSVAPDEKCLAFASSKGNLILLQHNVENRLHDRISVSPVMPPRYMQVDQDLVGASVTSLQWDTSGSRLFVGDSRGKVVCVGVSLKKNQPFFKIKTSMVVTLDSLVVQMDFCQGKLLISTQTGCYVCDTIREQYSQIGSKPRVGDFGACFYNNSPKEAPKMYAARPGSRFWEVDFDGNVACTHQFKNALLTPPVPPVSLGERFCPPDLNAKLEPPVPNFQKVTVICEKFILTSTKEKLLIFDPFDKRVLLWSMHTRDILQSKVHSSHLYLWDREGKLRNLQLSTVEEGINRILTRAPWKPPLCTKPLILAAELCLFYRSNVIAASARSVLPRVKLEELTANLQSLNEQALAKEMNQVLEELEKVAPPPEVRENDNSTYVIESGIYVVNRPSPGTVSANRTRRGDDANFGRSELDQEMAAGSSRGSPRSEADSRELHLPPDEDDGARNLPTSLAAVDYTSNPLDGYYYGSPMLLSLMEPYVWPGTLFDLDPSLAINLNPSAALDDLKNSISSKYGSGKKRIKNTIGVLGDHIKALGAEDSPEPFDVGDRSVSDESTVPEEFYLEGDHQDDDIIFTTKLKNAKFVQSSELYGLLDDVDTAELLRVTERAWQEVHDRDIFCDVDKLKTVLEKWVEVLLATQESTYRSLWFSACSTCKGVDNLPPITTKLGPSRSCLSLSEIEKSQETTQFLDEREHDSSPCGAASLDVDAQFSEQSPDCGLTTGNPVRPTPKPRLGHGVVRSRSMDRLVEAENADTATPHLDSGDPSGSDKRTRSPFATLEDYLRLQEATFCGPNNGLIESAPHDKCWLCFPRFFLVDPWRLTAETRKRVGLLTTMCVKTKVFGRIARFCDDSVVSGGSADGESISDASSSGRGSEAFSDYQECPVDRARAIFVRQFFHLLEPHTVFWDTRSEIGSTFRTWSAVLGGLLGHFNHSVPLSSLTDKRTHILRTLLAAARSQSLDFPQLVENVFRTFEAITFRDVLYLILIREEASGAKFFLELVEKMCTPPHSGMPNQKKYKLSTVETVCRDSVVHLALVKIILESSPKPSQSEIKCSCTNLKPWSYNSHFGRADLLLRIVKCSSPHREHFLQLCQDYGFWPGYLHLVSHEVGCRQNVLKSLVQLSDIALLRDPANICLVPQSAQEWKEMLELVIRQQKAKKSRQCLFCEATMPDGRQVADLSAESRFCFETVAQLFIRYSEMDVATGTIFDLVKLNPDMRMSSSFYRHLLSSASAKWHQRNLAYNVLEKVDAYVWSRNKNCASPQVYYQLQQERQGMPCKHESISRKRNLTDLHCHWGVTFNLGASCSVCTYPLTTRIASNAQGGIRVFPCGHGFHLRCVQMSSSCSVCP